MRTGPIAATSRRAKSFAPRRADRGARRRPRGATVQPPCPHVCRVFSAMTAANGRAGAGDELRRERDARDGRHRRKGDRRERGRFEMRERSRTRGLGGSAACGKDGEAEDHRADEYEEMRPVRPSASGSASPWLPAHGDGVVGVGRRGRDSRRRVGPASRRARRRRGTRSCRRSRGRPTRPCAVPPYSAPASAAGLWEPSGRSARRSTGAPSRIASTARVEELNRGESELGPLREPQPELVGAESSTRWPPASFGRGGAWAKRRAGVARTVSAAGVAAIG